MSAQLQFHPDLDKRKYGYSDLRYWSVITAYGLAAAEDIKLTSLHLVFLEEAAQRGILGQPVHDAGGDLI